MLPLSTHLISHWSIPLKRAFSTLYTYSYTIVLFVASTVYVTLL
jgi:hypothetical protein